MKSSKQLRPLFTMIAVASIVSTACGAVAPVPAPSSTQAPASAATTEATAAPQTEASTNELGVPLPADAAPWEQQVDVTYGEFGPWEHWAEGIYGLGTSVNYYTQEPLLTISPNNELVPYMAEKWESNDDATVWTFYLRKGLQWSDGTPITAKDWVFTFQYQADPENGFDFNWYYDPIKGLADAAEKKIKPTEIGVSAKDDQTLVFEMKSPTPYWPSLVASAFPLPKQAIDKCGKRVWSIKPECFVASGPYILTKYERDRIIVLSLNKNYKGIAKPVVKHYVHKYTPVKDVQGWALYEKDEITGVALGSAPANMQEEIRNDPKYTDQLYFSKGNYTGYIVMDPTKKPFDDARVRKAFALAMDRETLCKDVLKGGCEADYGLLPVGFPGDQSEALKPLTAYNPDEAKKLLSEAGYPDGQGFPELTFYVRSDSSHGAEAVVAMWQETLGVKLNIQSFDRTTFMQKMATHTFEIAQLGYGADYPDPINFLGLFLCATKRHDWCNQQYDELIDQSSKETDTAKRLQLMHDAEKILIEDVGVLPMLTTVSVTLNKPWLVSDALKDWKAGAPTAGFYCYFLLANQYYTKDTPKNWPPVDPQDLQ
ncbi:MAG: peptide ABC transporter substrate-binding protein [Chloroflexi bacterium]|nr:peptide ABC transporter substrate-binding protein [Chloroflexota bacterium]